MQLDLAIYLWKDISKCSSTLSNDNKHTWYGGSLTNQDSQRLEVQSLYPNISFKTYIINQITTMRNMCNRFSILRILETDYTCQLFT